MKRRRSQAKDQTPLDWTIEVLMAAMIMFLPLAYGTTQPWSQEIFFVFAGAVGAFTLLRATAYGDSLRWTWVYVPVIAFLMLVVAQRLPLPRDVLGILSPHTAALKDSLLAGVAPPGGTPLTFYNLATERQLRLVIAVATVFAVVVQQYRTPERRRRLLMSITAAGVAVAVVAAYQDLTRADLIYGITPIGHRNAGPFQNYSHFSQFMNLSVGAALAWVLMSLAGWSNGWRDATAAREQIQLAENAFVWPAAVFVLTGPLLVFASMSRMGMISALLAGAITAGLLGWRGRTPSGRRRRSGTGGPRGRSLFYVITFSIAVLAVLSVFGFDWVFDRLSTVNTQHGHTVGTRQNLIRDLVPLWRQFPLLGTGLGTHEFVFPMFNRQVSLNIFTHAENEYAQLMEETGLIGVLCAAAFVGIVAAAFVRVVRSPVRSEQYAAFGLGFGLIAVLIHSFSDFGQHVPADAALTAISCGLLICLARRMADENAVATVIATRSAGLMHEGGGAVVAPRPAGAPRQRLWAIAVPSLAAVAVLGVFGWVIVNADRERRAADHFAAAQDVGNDILAGQAKDETYVRLADNAAAARETMPGDVGYAHWAVVAEWQVLSHKATDPATGQLRFDTQRLDEVRRIVAELDAVRPLCPTFGPPLGLAGQLRSRVLGDSSGNEQIREAYRLTPHDRDLSRMAGMQAIDDKRWDDAVMLLGRYVQLGGPVWQVVDAFLVANRPDLAQSAAAGDWWNLQRLALGLKVGWPKEQARAAECRTESERLLVKESESSGSTPDVWFERGGLEARNGRAADAALWYQKAVEAEYDRPDWRLALAKSLMAVDRDEDADRELRVCLRQRPGWGEAEQLLNRRLRRRPNNATGG